MQTDKRYDQTLVAIRALHSDSKVTLDQTAERLRGLRDEIDVLLDGVESDLRRRDNDQ